MNRDTEKRIHKLFAGVSSSLKETDPEFAEIIANFSQGEVAEANRLTEKEQMLCILSALLGCQGMGEFQNMLHAALNAGVAPIAIKEVIYQATTNEKTRFEDGLAKQVELFGENMEKRQTDGPVLRRNINRWLADNCFGDYYTRNGLNDQEREMITFCFILAQGGCENQIRGHTAGNLGVGNDKEKLYSVVEQCMPYIGYPRSLNAMNIIDEVSRAMENQ